MRDTRATRVVGGNPPMITTAARGGHTGLLGNASATLGDRRNSRPSTVCGTTTRGRSRPARTGRRRHRRNPIAHPDRPAAEQRRARPQRTARPLTQGNRGHAQQRHSGRTAIELRMTAVSAGASARASDRTCLDRGRPSTVGHGARAGLRGVGPTCAQHDRTGGRRVRDRYPNGAGWQPPVRLLARRYGL